MNWEAVGAIGELLGSVAVLATLVYLARQIRHMQDDVARSTNQNRAGIIRSLLVTRATNLSLRDDYMKAYLALGGQLPDFCAALVERTGLSEEGAAALYWEQLAWWQYRLEVFSHVDELTPAQRQEFDNGIRQNYGSQPIERMFFESSKSRLPKDLVDYIDEVIKT